MALGKQELANRFGYHAATAETGPQHDDIRQAFFDFAVKIDGNVPDGRDKSLALTALEEAMHWTNAAIAKTAPLSGSVAESV